MICFILFDLMVWLVYRIVIECDIFVIVSKLWFMKRIDNECVWFSWVKSLRICVLVVGFILWVGLLVINNLGCDINVIVIINFCLMLVGIWCGNVFK